jgi:hypothetical protein
MPSQAELQLLIDKMAIQDLAVRYCDATTRGDWDAFASLWMPDGVWAESAPFSGGFSGIAEIRNRSKALLDGQDVFIQICHGVVVDEISGNHARAHATVQGIARGLHGSCINYVIFKDRLVKSDGIWRYASRDLHNIYYDDTALTGKRVLTRDEVASVCRVEE